MAKKKYKDVNGEYYTLEEEEMQTLITNAKKGVSKDQMELLKIFDNFLTKYTNLLYRGKYNLNDYDVRKFIALFVKDPQARFYLVRNKLNDGGKSSVNDAMRGIIYMVNRYCSEEDVRQTVDLTFLQCIMRYERKGTIPFSGYLYSYYYYMLKKNVDAFMIDQLGRKSFPLITDDEDEDREELIPGYTVPAAPSVEELLGPEDVDEFWVVGDSAIFPFDQLSIQERQLLKWRYVDGLRSSDISNKITEHQNTVREHFHRIRDKLSEILDDEENMMI